MAHQNGQSTITSINSDCKSFPNFHALSNCQVLLIDIMRVSLLANFYLWVSPFIPLFADYCIFLFMNCLCLCFLLNFLSILKVTFLDRDPRHVQGRRCSLLCCSLSLSEMLLVNKLVGFYFTDIALLSGLYLFFHYFIVHIELFNSSEW